MKGKGILLDTANDLTIEVIRDSNRKIIQGISIGDTVNQNISLILKMQPGEVKEKPTVGVGIDNMLLDKDSLLYKHKIREQLNVEGMQVNHLDINGKEIEINAEYKQ